MTENIKKFLATAYSDEKLAALLAHTESGRLAFYSCCCLIGIPTSPHALGGQMEMVERRSHQAISRETLPFAAAAEVEFYNLAGEDAERRERLLPLIHAEIARRDTENWEAAQEEDEVLTGAQ